MDIAGVSLTILILTAFAAYAIWADRQRRYRTEQRVEDGARLLDLQDIDSIDIPWAARVDLGLLDMADPGKDVIFQVFGDYTGGLQRLFPNADPAELYELSKMHGLEAGPTDDYSTLNRLWRDQIRLRLTAERAS